MLRGFVCALEVGEIAEEEDVVTTATKGGPHKEVLDRITGQRWDPSGVEKTREGKRPTCVA